jgi:hypothetical protein
MLVKAIDEKGKVVKISFTRARILLEQKKAKIIKRNPLVIQFTQLYRKKLNGNTIC